MSNYFPGTTLRVSAINDAGPMPITAQPGMQLGHFVLESLLADRGSHATWLARPATPSALAGPVVARLFPAAWAKSPGALGTAWDDTQAAIALDHPGIARVLQQGRKDELCFVVVERVVGWTVAELIAAVRAKLRAAPTWLVLHVASCVTEVLQTLHGSYRPKSRGWKGVHGALSSANILFTAEGQVRVLDAGLGAWKAAAHSCTTGSGEPWCLACAPEWISTSRIGPVADPRADIYSLGVVLYELATGAHPCPASPNLAERLIRLKQGPAAPTLTAPWISEQLEELLLKALSSSLGKRYPTAGSLRFAIDQCLAASKLQPSTRHVQRYLEVLFAPESTQPEGVESPSGRDGSLLNDPDSWESEGGSPLKGPDSAGTILSQVARVTEPGGQVLRCDAEDDEGPPPTRRGDGLSAWGPLFESEEEAPTATARVVPKDLPAEESAEARGSSPPVVEVSAVREVNTQSQEKTSHAWDLVMQKVRQDQVAEVHAALGPESGARTTSQSDRSLATAAGAALRGWDAALERVRSSPGRDSPSQRLRTIVTGSAESRPDRLASAKFEEGLECLRRQDLDGALVAWTEALELDPSNRVLDRNLKKLKRDMKKT